LLLGPLPSSAFTLAAALEAGVVSPTERIDCEQGKWTYQGEPFHDSHTNGLLTVPELFAVSSNVGFAKIFDRVGGERIERTLRAFHFGASPAIEGAASGSLPEHIADHSVAGAMLAIGESMTASPLQVAAAYGAIGNGGLYVAPTLVRRTGEASREHALSPETAHTVTTMLEGVVTSPHVTGTLAQVEGQRVAGKTGTAEWELPDGSKHSYSSFVGFVPATSPRFVILVGLEQALDKDGDTAGGGEAAAPAFSRIATRALAR
jgi:cell division protein FtsI (penicillin-binding protein 3)